MIRVKLRGAEVVKARPKSGHGPDADARGQFKNAGVEAAVDLADEHRARVEYDAIAGIRAERNGKSAASATDRARIDDGAGVEIDPDTIVVAGSRITRRDDPGRLVDDGPALAQVSTTLVSYGDCCRRLSCGRH